MKKTIVATMISSALLIMTGCQKDISTQASRDVEMNKSEKATIWTATIQLYGSNEVPTNDYKAHGVAVLRLTADKMLHSMVIVEAEEAAGMLTASHIHEAAEGSNGPVKIFLAHNISEFGVMQHTQLTDDQFNLLTDESKHLYVNAHSTVKPAGLVRGQIR